MRHPRFDQVIIAGALCRSGVAVCFQIYSLLRPEVFIALSSVLMAVAIAEASRSRKVTRPLAAVVFLRQVRESAAGPKQLAGPGKDKAKTPVSSCVVQLVSRFWRCLAQSSQPAPHACGCMPWERELLEAKVTQSLSASSPSSWW